MTLKRQIKASMEGSINRLSVVAFFMGVCKGQIEVMVQWLKE